MVVLIIMLAFVTAVNVFVISLYMKGLKSACTEIKMLVDEHTKVMAMLEGNSITNASEISSLNDRLYHLEEKRYGKKNNNGGSNSNRNVYAEQ